VRIANDTLLLSYQRSERPGVAMVSLEQRTELADPQSHSAVETWFGRILTLLREDYDAYCQE
jgi:hypothetical protein